MLLAYPGAVVESYDYDDYGMPLDDATRQPLTASAFGNPCFFTGRRWHPELGLYNYRTRWYDPASGRFTTRDTIGIWGDANNLGNAFAYVGNNPWTRMDPSGRLDIITASALAGLGNAAFNIGIRYIEGHPNPWDKSLLARDFLVGARNGYRAWSGRESRKGC